MGEISALRQILGHLTDFRRLYETHFDRTPSGRPPSDADIDANVRAAEDSIVPVPVAARLPTVSSLTVSEIFSVGLPSNFGQPPDSIMSNWKRQYPQGLATVMDHGPSDSFLPFVWSVFSGAAEEAMYRSFGDHSLWIFALFPDEFREAFRSNSGAPVTSPPVPILVGGERAVFFVSKESHPTGREVPMWHVYVAHESRLFEVMMTVAPESEAKYADAFWTICGTWEWKGDPQVAARFSPDRKWWWDGSQWRSAVSDDGNWRWDGQNWVPNQVRR